MVGRGDVHAVEVRAVRVDGRGRGARDGVRRGRGSRVERGERGDGAPLGGVEGRRRGAAAVAREAREDVAREDREALGRVRVAEVDVRER